MTENQIKQKLSKVMNGDNIFTSRNIFISIDDFLKMFGDVELNYDSLINHKNTTEENGWKSIFDNWHENGILN